LARHKHDRLSEKAAFENGPVLLLAFFGKWGILQNVEDIANYG
jgi:hypothetical protein